MVSKPGCKFYWLKEEKLSSTQLTTFSEVFIKFSFSKYFASYYRNVKRVTLIATETQKLQENNRKSKKIFLQENPLNWSSIEFSFGKKTWNSKSQSKVHFVFTKTQNYRKTQKRFWGYWKMVKRPPVLVTHTEERNLKTITHLKLVKNLSVFASKSSLKQQKYTKKLKDC